MNRISLLQGDITKLSVDAIVNAANNSLQGGGGVDGAIHRAGGPVILEECRKIGGCPTGGAVITTAGKMPSKHVIHTVGPVWNPEKTTEMTLLLANCYRNSLRLAVEKGLKTVAFPNISTGVYGYPKDKAARVAISTVKSFLETTSSIEEVTFVCFDDENYQLYKKGLED